jgi:hypothetical protein
MQVAQTAEVPPNHGRIILAMTGWTAKSRKADNEIVTAYKSMAGSRNYLRYPNCRLAWLPSTA